MFDYARGHRKPSGCSLRVACDDSIEANGLDLFSHLSEQICHFNQEEDDTETTIEQKPCVSVSKDSSRDIVTVSIRDSPAHNEQLRGLNTDPY